MNRTALALLLALAAGPAAAKDDNGLRFDPSHAQNCLADGGWRDCIGVAAQRCMEFTEGGYSTQGMSGCLAAEHAWWDGELNALYQELRARERAGDADWQPIPGMLPRPSGADALRDMQRAWIVFRDATCRYEELQWWGGTGASGAMNGCLMRVTAEQVLALRGYLAEG